MKYKLCNIVEWMAAMVIAILSLNIVTFFYYHPPNEISRDYGATPGVFFPGERCLEDEGYAIHRIDSRGYVNPEKDFGDSYILAIGSSHTEGFQVRSGSRWSDLLDGYMGDDDVYSVYNIGHSGFYFPEIVKRFQTITEEFPDSTSMIIEITDTEFSFEALCSALEQTDFNHSQTVDSLISSLTIRELFVIRFKQTFPIFRLVRKQIIAIKNNFSEEVYDTTNKSADWNVAEGGGYREALTRAIQLVRSGYAGNIYIVYHPTVTVEHDGTMEVSEKETDKIFEEVCEDNDIIFVNLSEAFSECYMQRHEVPYGFWNTTMCAGHMNKIGHRIFAGEIYKIMEDVE